MDICGNTNKINAVEGYLSPSSRSNEKMNWDEITIKEFFKQKIK